MTGLLAKINSKANALRNIVYKNKSLVFGRPQPVYANLIEAKAGAAGLEVSEANRCVDGTDTAP